MSPCHVTVAGSDVDRRGEAASARPLSIIKASPRRHNLETYRNGLHGGRMTMGRS